MKEKKNIINKTLKSISLNSKEIYIPLEYNIHRSLRLIRGINEFRCNLILLVSNIPARITTNKLSLREDKYLKLGINRLNFMLDTNLKNLNKNKFKK